MEPKLLGSGLGSVEPGARAQ
uniref:Uncharacterized protein n=1 Tax=Nymphaea colorata TaxID=210225 RepID=A0A5K0ZMB6_9MAGN